MHVFSLCFFGLVNNVKFMNAIASLTAEGYDLMVIEDEEVPLSVAPTTGYFFATVSAVCVIALLFAFALWYYKRAKLCERLRQLRIINGITDIKEPILIKDLESEIERLEIEISASML